MADQATRLDNSDNRNKNKKSCLKSSSTSRNHSLHLHFKSNNSSSNESNTNNVNNSQRNRRSLSTFPNILNYTNNSSSTSSNYYYNNNDISNQAILHNNNEMYHKSSNTSKHLNDSNNNLIVTSNKDESPTYSITYEDMEIFNRLTNEQLNVDNSRWLSEKPLSVLLLDSADRAVLKIADQRDKVQKKTFTKWVNKHLNKINVNVKELFEDLRQGINLILLLEILANRTLVSL